MPPPFSEWVFRSQGVSVRGIFRVRAPRICSKYEEYVRECAAAGLSLGVRIGVRPIGSCIEARSKLFAASMHFGKGVGEVTHQKWVFYF